MKCLNWKSLIVILKMVKNNTLEKCSNAPNVHKLLHRAHLCQQLMPKHVPWGGARKYPINVRRTKQFHPVDGQLRQWQNTSNTPILDWCWWFKVSNKSAPSFQEKLTSAFLRGNFESQYSSDNLIKIITKYIYVYTSKLSKKIHPHNS